MPTTMEFRLALPTTTEAAFAWHARPGALLRLLPPWQPLAILRNDASLAVGSEVHIRPRLLGLALPPTFVARHAELRAPELFVDEMLRGPLRAWRHAHRFEPGPAGTAAMVDAVSFALPWHPLSAPIFGGLAAREIRRMFAFRHRRTDQDLRRVARIGAEALGGPRRIGVTGGSGAVGSALVAFLRTAGHEVVVFGRHPGQAAFDALAGTVDAAALAGLDAVVHLAGAPISTRWSPRAQEEIRRSREVGTRALATAVAAQADGPRRLVSASAVGFYGASEAPLDEQAAQGQGFAASVCAAWEAATEPATAAGVSVCRARLGVVLDPATGALAKMLPAFRAGAGGPVGDGRQVMSWISLDDAVYALAELTLDPALRLEGPVNLVAPDHRPQREFAAALGRAVRRPAIVPLSAFAVRALFGAMGEELLLGGAPVLPARLQEAGFHFAYPELQGALDHLLGTER